MAMIQQGSQVLIHPSFHVPYCKNAFTDLKIGEGGTLFQI